LPTGYDWKVQGAKRRNKKGRPMGGMILGIRKDLIGQKEEEGREVEGLIARRINYGKGDLRVVRVYVNKDMERKLEGLKEWLEEKERGVRTLIGGDFNARSGDEGGKIEEEEGEGNKYRRSKDRKINGEGKRLIDCVRERGWWILNGEIRGDEEGNWTYTGSRRESIIDYVLINEELEEEIDQLIIGDNIDSDHHPLIVRLKERGGGRSKRGKERRIQRGMWNEKGRERFKAELGRVEVSGGKVQEEVGKMEGRIKEIIKRMETERREYGKRKGWWDAECREKKREVRRALRVWRKGNGDKQRYLNGKKEYREICEEKKREENERWEREVEEARVEEQVWGIVNRERKRWKGINEDIKMEEWEEYFKELLGGVERRVVQGKNRRGRREEEEDLRREEIRGILKKVKDGKALGVDGIPGEAWKCGGEGMEEWV